MSTLYDLSAEHRDIIDAIEANGGELPPDLEARMDALHSSIEEKVAGYIRLFREWELCAEAKKAEAQRLSESAASDINRAKHMKERLMQMMQLADLRSVASPLGTVRIVTPSSFSVKFHGSPDTLPDEWCKVERKANLSAVKDHIKATGEVPDGFEQVATSPHIRVK